MTFFDRFYQWCAHLVGRIPGMQWAERLLLRYAELFIYAFFGVLTTCVNFAVYLPLSRLLSAQVPNGWSAEEWRAAVATLANAAAWCLSVLFAFFVNRVFVFHDKSEGGRMLLQLAQFYLSRLATGALEIFLPSLLIVTLAFHDVAAKLLVSVLVILLNFVFAKWITFRKKKEDAKDTSEAPAEDAQNS